MNYTIPLDFYGVIVLTTACYACPRSSKMTGTIEPSSYTHTSDTLTSPLCAFFFDSQGPTRVEFESSAPTGERQATAMMPSTTRSDGQQPSR